MGRLRPSSPPGTRSRRTLRLHDLPPLGAPPDAIHASLSGDVFGLVLKDAFFPVGAIEHGDPDDVLTLWNAAGLRWNTAPEAELRDVLSEFRAHVEDGTKMRLAILTVLHPPDPASVH